MVENGPRPIEYERLPKGPLESGAYIEKTKKIALSGRVQDTPPPHIAQCLFEIVSQRGSHTHFASRKYR